MLQWVSCSVVRRRGGRNCFCVWRFWRTVICPADSERLSEGRSLNSLCPGCEGSAVIFPARFLTLEVYRSWMVGRLALMIFSADLIVRWSLFLSSLVADPKQTMIEVLLGLLDDGVDVGFPLQVPGDCGSQKPEGFDSQHSIVEYGEGGQCWGAPPEVHCHLHGFK